MIRYSLELYRCCIVFQLGTVQTLTTSNLAWIDSEKNN